MLSPRVRFATEASLMLVFALGCSGDAWSLRDHARASDPRFAELRRRMAMTILSRPDGAPSATEGETEVNDFASETAEDYCDVPASCPTTTNTADCSPHRPWAAAHLCVANLLMRVLPSPAPTEIEAAPLGQKTFFTIPPQDQPTNVALAEVAAEYADSAATHVDRGIPACNTAGDLGDCANGALTPPQCVDLAG